MSEFSNNQAARAELLSGYAVGLTEGQYGLEMLEKYRILETKFQPEDILVMFDNLLNWNFSVEEIKTTSNKIFNILFKTLTPFRRTDYPKNSILFLLTTDNAGIKKHLATARNDIKEANRECSPDVIARLANDFRKMDLQLLEFELPYADVKRIKPEISGQGQRGELPRGSGGVAGNIRHSSDYWRAAAS